MHMWLHMHTSYNIIIEYMRICTKIDITFNQKLFDGTIILQNPRMIKMWIEACKHTVCMYVP